MLKNYCLSTKYLNKDILKRVYRSRLLLIRTSVCIDEDYLKEVRLINKKYKDSDYVIIISDVVNLFYERIMKTALMFESFSSFVRHALIDYILNFNQGKNVIKDFKKIQDKVFKKLKTRTKNINENKIGNDVKIGKKEYKVIKVLD